jgi:hypothetical protein
MVGGAAIAFFLPVFGRHERVTHMIYGGAAGLAIGFCIDALVTRIWK